MIHVERVRRQFGPQVLFEELSWLIPRGARLGLVGPNGTGKTSLLRVLAGLDPPDAGIIHRPAAVRIGYLAQEVETVGRGSVLSVVLDGFGEIRDLEEKLEALESKLSGLRPRDPESGRMTQAYGELRHRFEALGGDEIEAKAKACAHGRPVGVGFGRIPVVRRFRDEDHLHVPAWFPRAAQILVAPADIQLPRIGGIRYIEHLERYVTVREELVL